MIHRIVAALAVGMLLISGGISAGQARPERFAPSDVEKKIELDPIATSGLRILIEEKFGRPDTPRAWDELPVDFGQRDLAAGKATGWKLQEGNALFNQRCADCHGKSGDGAGVKAALLVPRPRDFRRGWFKFRSTGPDSRGFPGKPLAHDLAETLRLGLPGTAMPAFNGLEPHQAAALVEYVRWLAIRGEFETQLIRLLEGADEAADVERILDGKYQEALKQVVESWLIAQRESSIARPARRIEPSAASLAAGKKLFTANVAGCNKCHGDDGKGLPNFKFPDGWNNPAPVWDLTSGLYRGGIEPADVFRRLRHGMMGSAMPMYRESDLPDENVWHLVNYTLSLASRELRERQVVRRPPPQGAADDSPLTVRTRPAPAPPPPQANWKGWGTLRGRFVYQGQPPATPALPVNRDIAVCGDKYESDTFLIDKEGGLANVVVYLRTKETPWKEVFEPRMEPAVLEIFKCRLRPHVIVVPAGERFVVQNSDPIGHNVRAAPGNAAGFNVNLPAGDRVTLTRRAAEDLPVPVTNAIHPWMLGYLLPRDNPYFAVTGADGRFEIAKLPAGGPLEFQVWHERAPRSLTAGGWKGGRYSIELVADEIQNLGDIILTPPMFR
jgi:mono/diheme cytochrome c family protein